MWLPVAGSEPEGHWQPTTYDVTYRTQCQNIGISEYRETIQAEYQPSKRIEDHKAGAIGGVGQWPTHPPAGRAGGAGAHNILIHRYCLRHCTQCRIATSLYTDIAGIFSFDIGSFSTISGLISCGKKMGLERPPVGYRY